MLQRKNLYLENIAVFRSKEKNLFDKNQLHRLEEKLLEKGIYMTGPVILHNRDVQNTDYELLISVNRTEKGLRKKGRRDFIGRLSMRIVCICVDLWGKKRFLRCHRRLRKS